MQTAAALVATLISACALNVGYLIEHSVASRLPPLSPRQPLRSVRLLLGERRWLFGFGVEAIGWLLYVLALALAPLSLVQATAAGFRGAARAQVGARAAAAAGAEGDQDRLLVARGGDETFGDVATALRAPAERSTPQTIVFMRFSLPSL